ncbi:MAG: ABC transporter permease [Anaerolineae bacterium]|jgi:ABC-2 type transport system permease protein
MNATRTGLRESLRVIGAITAKDMLDAIKDAKILVVLLSALVVVVLYKTMPSWLDADLPPRLALYDAGNSNLVAQLEQSTEFDLLLMSSQAEMERYVGDQTKVVQGLVLPAGFDQAVESSDPLELDGYVDHWVSDAAADESRSFFEEQLTELTGKPVQIRLESDTVYTHPYGGQTVMVAFVLVFVLVILGLTLTPNLMIDEKEARTMEALLVSPASAGQVVIAKALAGLFYSLVAAAVVLAVFATTIAHWEVAILAVLSGSLLGVALGLLLGTVISVRQQLILWSSVLMVPLFLPVMLSVILADIQAPASVRTLVDLIPTVALSKVVRLAVAAEAPWTEVGPALALVAGCATLLLVVVAWLVRRSDR